MRAQAVRRDGSLEDDFVLQADGRVLLVRNAPSPAATASLAIAEHIVSALETRAEGTGMHARHRRLTRLDKVKPS